MTVDSSRYARRRVAVVGAGSWGTALALVAARNGHEVRVWARESEVALSINREQKNPFYLSDFALPENITATTSLEDALADTDFVLMVVPSHAMRDCLFRMKDHLKPETVIVSATKGVENGSLMRMSEVIGEVLNDRADTRVVALSGPSFAREVARKDPTAIVAASADQAACEMVQHNLSSNVFRVYTNSDVAGVELGGAVKNVVAIAAGVVRGLGMGTNTVAAIITRGLAEITRLAVAEGAKGETMAGLAGLGDLVLTCTGELSRNRHVGLELGRGRRLADILADMREVAEGVKTTRAIYELSRRRAIDMPITASTYALLYEDKPAAEAANELMERPLKSE
ncbi:MAG TPA: NAD(P)H-dependent glycerol-3-phosphate dehydrogenase [Blastocatellia bacterium]|nr:NAD(P)H-dependent glycerol-3-phosphate dehydrogenase [Blastocatellia bacterium]